MFESELLMEHRDLFRRTLEIPRIYSAFQNIMGAHSGRQRLVEMLDIRPGDRILDVGCGPADILNYLPDVDYVGIDYSPSYIEAARHRFGDQGRFFVADLATIKEHVEGDFDLVTAVGVLHHLDDVTAMGVMRAARDCLKKGGRFFAVDPLIEYPQNPIARILARLDRGKFVRTLEGYAGIARSAFEASTVEPCRDMLRIPYSHAIMRCHI